KEDDQGNVQAQLLMGFGLEQSIDYRGQVMGILLSQYLAGDQSSKLFTQIREQLGAAYNVEASCFANNSLFLVSAGLDPSKIAAARKIILSEMGKLVQGEVEDDLFKKAKKAILRNMKIGLDGQNWQMGQMLRDELFSGYLDFDRENAIRRATPKQLVAFVQNLFFKMMKPKIIKKEYQSGFKAEIILKPHFYQRFFGIIVDFGSSDPQKVAGSAHFLEHKLFAKKDGDLSTQFEDIGADVNAFTSFNETMFYCSGIEHTPKMIDLLFELVGQPYFTKENIAQEAPIIEQELAMYQDDPTWSVNNAIMHDMFGDSNLGIEVVGTKESINQVTVKNLTQVYEANYVPEKMQFVACGDFSDNQVQTILQQVGKLQQKYLHGKGKSTAEKQVSFRMLHDQVLPARGN